MMNKLYQNVNQLLEKTKNLIETLLLRYGNRLMETIYTLPTTPISYKNDRRYGLNFRIISGVPFVVNDNYLERFGDKMHGV